MLIFVIGYMAAGKTTFGSNLAKKLDVPFIDLDAFIEEQKGASIPEIFSSQGESEFRKIETEALHKLTKDYSTAIIACGGGTPCFNNNMEFLNSHGITVFLETSTPVLIERLLEENESRPLVAHKSEDEIRQKVLSQLCERLPVYMEAKLKWHGDDLENESQIERNISEFVESYPSLFR